MLVVYQPAHLIKRKANGDKDKEIHNLSDCELENELRDFNNLPIDDLDRSNDIYGEGLPLEDNIYQINDDLGYSH